MAPARSLLQTITAQLPSVSLTPKPKPKNSYNLIADGQPVPPLPSGAEQQILAPPVVNSGCVLQPPPTTAKVGDVFAFNITDWKRAKDKDEKQLTFRSGLNAAGAAWVQNQYAQISSTKFRGTWATILSGVNRTFPKFDLPSRSLKMFAMSGGWGTYSQQYKGFQVPYEIPGQMANLDPGVYWLWHELIDGKVPIAKVEPPFEDSNHEWGLYVEWTDRVVLGVDVATGQTQSQPEVKIRLRREPRGWLATIEYGIGVALAALKAVAEFICAGITYDKLQDVRNYGTLFPEPTVQASVMAWQGLAQACGMAFPAAATGPPDCASTGEPPALPAPLPWWEVHKNWLIGGGIAAAGLVTIVVVLSRRSAS